MVFTIFLPLILLCVVVPVGTRRAFIAPLFKIVSPVLISRQSEIENEEKQRYINVVSMIICARSGSRSDAGDLGLVRPTVEKGLRWRLESRRRRRLVRPWAGSVDRP
jgi:hypothetical protein